MIGMMQITTSALRSKLCLAICLMAIAGGCVYEMPIQQGNFLDATALVQVKKGMTRAQVRYLLGTPMVPSGFDNDRWDYDYYLKLQQLKTPRRARAAVYFTNDVVDHVDSDVMPVARDVATAADGEVASPTSPTSTSPSPAAGEPLAPPAAAPTTAPANPADGAPPAAAPDPQPPSP